MKHKVLVLGAGRSSFFLIDYLYYSQKIALTIFDRDQELLDQKKKLYSSVNIILADINIDNQVENLIQKSDLIVSLLPPDQHFGIAILCLQYSKNFATASYLSQEIKNLDIEAKEKNITFLMECGLDPGLDHISLMKMIDDIHSKNGKITSLISLCGGLMSDQSDSDNPWKYKISWNPINVVKAGQAGAVFLENGQIVKYNPNQIFNNYRNLQLDQEYEFYANRDSLPYQALFGLNELQTCLRGTIRKKGFCDAWQQLIEWKLTDDEIVFSSDQYSTWKQYLIGHNCNLDIDPKIESQITFLQIVEDKHFILKGNHTIAAQLQALLLQKWKLQIEDQDLVLMHHMIEYEINDQKKTKTSTLKVIGTNSIQTAMAKTVGLPLAISVLLILDQKTESGVVLPLNSVFYDHILPKLAKEGITFIEN